MAGTLEGGRAAAKTNKERYGDDFYVKRGYESAAAIKKQPRGERKPRGFAYHAIHNPDKMRADSAKGGKKSRRGKI